MRTKVPDNRNEVVLLGDVISLRKSLKLTQKELAGMSRSTQQEISRLEKQRHSPSLKTICQIINSVDYELALVKRDKQKNRKEK